MPEEEYSVRITSEWNSLLSSDPKEREVQEFLEKNVSLLPGALGLGGANGGKGPLRNVVFSQPKLDGITRRVPDFMWIAHNSSVLSPTCIEIERPGKRWFNKDGTPTAHLVQAIDQLNEWRFWFSMPENVLWFRNNYRLDHRQVRRCALRPFFILIYGRASEFEEGGVHANPEILNQKRANMEKHGETFMTFDRLEIDRRMFNCFCATTASSGFRVKEIPPTFRAGPALISDLVHEFSGWPDAISKIDQIPPERRDYLMERMEYWLEKSREFTDGGYIYDGNCLE